MAESYVGKPCPKCQHKRTANEVAPDWQCPKCGVAYAKFIAAQQGAATTMTGTMPATQKGYVARPSAATGSTGLAMFVHLSIVIGWIVPFFGLIVPIVVWITKKDSDELATANAKEAINFQITTVLWGLLVLGIVLLGMKNQSMGILITGGVVAVVLAIVFLILPIIGAVKANRGDEYRYPFTIHIFS